MTYCNMVDNNSMIEDNIAAIEALKSTEATYEVKNYLKDEESRKRDCHGSYKKEQHEVRRSTGELMIRRRQYVCEWCYEMVDTHGIAREAVEYTMNFADRFCSHYNLLQHQGSQQNTKLLISAGLILAIKTQHLCNDKETLDNIKESLMKSILFDEGDEHSHDLDTEKLITAPMLSPSMETLLLRTLEFHILPPIPSRYVQEYLMLLMNVYSSDHNKEEAELEHEIVVSYHEAIEEWALHFTDIAVMDYSITILNKPSLVGLAAVLSALILVSYTSTIHTQGNAIEDVTKHMVLHNLQTKRSFTPTCICQPLVKELTNILYLDSSDIQDTIEDIQQTLWTIVDETQIIEYCCGSSFSLKHPQEESLVLMTSQPSSTSIKNATSVAHNNEDSSRGQQSSSTNNDNTHLSNRTELRQTSPTSIATSMVASDTRTTDFN